MFDASRQFTISKAHLLEVKSWKFTASIIDGVVEVKVVFNMNVRNKIVEKSPIIVERMQEGLRNSEMSVTIN